MGHSVECTLRREAIRDKNREFKERYPNYCKTCHGWGEVQDGTDSYLDGLEPCPDCVGNGICPRCGEHSLDLGGSRNKCISCGWEEYESEGLGFNHFCMCGYSLTEVFE